ncbi:MAG: hypothetical protein IJP54_06290 [Synergistaceae bacterium]|nr:hypothetical protein [Synergistaceae bacterium]
MDCLDERAIFEGLYEVEEVIGFVCSEVECTRVVDGEGWVTVVWSDLVRSGDAASRMWDAEA